MSKSYLNRLSMLLIGGIFLGAASFPASAHWANMNIGTFDSGSMSQKLPFGGAFTFTQPDIKELPGRYERRTKLFFGIKDGYWSIAYKSKPEIDSVDRREFGRFAVTAVDVENNKYEITLYDADFKGVYNASVKESTGYDPDSCKVPLADKKVVAVMELSVDKEKKLVVGKVVKADSQDISYVEGDMLPMKAKDTLPNIPNHDGSKDSHKSKDSQI